MTATKSGIDRQCFSGLDDPNHLYLVAVTFFASFFASFALIMGGCSTKVNPRQELDHIQGTWHVLAVETYGEPAPEEWYKNMKIVIEEDTMSIIEERGGPKPRIERMVLVLNPSTNPKSVDLKNNKESKEKPALGIYEIDGDTLKICFDKDGDHRPTSFADKKNPPSASFILTRAKKG